ncbi:MAG: histidine phosphatase family protein [Pseudomonadota bacterium]
MTVTAKPGTSLGQAGVRTKRSDTTRWWWIRHAPVINPSGTIYGQGDLHADTDDPEAYTSLARLLPQQAIWMHTSLLRTIETGQAVIAARQAADPSFDVPNFEIEPAFMEQSFGNWQGQDRAQIRAQLGRDHPLWLAPAHLRAPDGESFLDLLARVGHGIEERNKRHAGRDIICFAHGGTIRAVISHVMGIAPETALGFQIDNLAITEVTYFPATDISAAHWTVGVVNMPPRYGIRFDLPQSI